eukprot:1457213-Pyramimonas_sp.AAC.1
MRDCWIHALGRGASSESTISRAPHHRGAHYPIESSSWNYVAPWTRALRTRSSTQAMNMRSLTAIPESSPLLVSCQEI